ncbi:MAG TPA: alpha/beta hydrolase [Stellaceae bacterium]|nr:alpha/beta hydrolase [Stellaceae bacterium]
MALYRNYDRAGLDAQYFLRGRVPEHPEYFRRWKEESEAVRRARACTLDIAYDVETLDLFPAEKMPAPCLLFIHGGYWQALDKSDFSFLAPAFQDAGVAVAVVNYTLAPKAKMDEIVRQNRAAVAWLARRARENGIDPARIHVAGHSAGGHLTAMVLATDWTAFGLDHNPVRGACAISGLYDLEPIRLCYLNDVLGLDAAMAERNSPLHHLPRRSPPLILSVGTGETDEFLRQQAEFASAWRAARLPLEIADQPGDHHFEVVGRLGQPKSPLHQAVMRQIWSSSSAGNGPPRQPSSPA